MKSSRLICLLVAALLLTSLLAFPQSSSRRPRTAPRSDPTAVFDSLEQQREHDVRQQQREKLAREAAARQQRQAERAHLAEELPRLIGLAQQLQTQLNSTDLDTTLPADLEQQAQQLEQLARQVRKRIRGL